MFHHTLFALFAWGCFPSTAQILSVALLFKQYMVLFVSDHKNITQGRHNTHFITLTVCFVAVGIVFYPAATTTNDWKTCGRLFRVNNTLLKSVTARSHAVMQVCLKINSQTAPKNLFQFALYYPIVSTVCITEFLTQQQDHCWLQRPVPAFIKSSIGKSFVKNCFLTLNLLEEVVHRVPKNIGTVSIIRKVQ